ncbi:uncharacterized protein LOC129589536 isoform X2 [Paramacrobiotus metropolitanus]|uniref:uncharacterized protein LOC129589536 isoform X2 n=1 Tax=Paramacrobiotus metropolitanus TaxID=2943436 RepID=UPI002446580B|nr:uncharacterized protein LOC129589536 isoform X2 [Paramacrobiotus metropolitanus]
MHLVFLVCIIPFIISAFFTPKTRSLYWANRFLPFVVTSLPPRRFLRNSSRHLIMRTSEQLPPDELPLFDLFLDSDVMDEEPSKSDFDVLPPIVLNVDNDQNLLLPEIRLDPDDTRAYDRFYGPPPRGPPGGGRGFPGGPPRGPPGPPPGFRGPQPPDHRGRPNFGGPPPRGRDDDRRPPPRGRDEERRPPPGRDRSPPPRKEAGNSDRSPGRRPPPGNRRPSDFRGRPGNDRLGRPGERPRDKSPAEGGDNRDESPARDREGDNRSRPGPPERPNARSPGPRRRQRPPSPPSRANNPSPARPRPPVPLPSNPSGEGGDDEEEESEDEEAIPIRTGPPIHTRPTPDPRPFGPPTLPQIGERPMPPITTHPLRPTPPNALATPPSMFHPPPPPFPHGHPPRPPMPHHPPGQHPPGNPHHRHHPGFPPAPPPPVPTTPSTTVQTTSQRRQDAPGKESDDESDSDAETTPKPVTTPAPVALPPPVPPPPIHHHRPHHHHPPPQPMLPPPPFQPPRAFVPPPAPPPPPPTVLVTLPPATLPPDTLNHQRGGVDASESANTVKEMGREGDSLRLVCPLKPQPETQASHIIWTTPEQMVFRHGKSGRHIVQPAGALIVHNLQSIDEGAYTCSLVHGKHIVRNGTVVVSIEDCSMSPCMNGGECEDLDGKGGAKLQCRCPEAFTGRYCETKKNIWLLLVPIIGAGIAAIAIIALIVRYWCFRKKPAKLYQPVPVGPETEVPAEVAVQPVPRKSVRASYAPMAAPRYDAAVQSQWPDQRRYSFMRHSDGAQMQAGYGPLPARTSFVAPTRTYSHAEPWRYSSGAVVQSDGVPQAHFVENPGTHGPRMGSMAQHGVQPEMQMPPTDYAPPLAPPPFVGHATGQRYLPNGQHRFS